ncbi:MAG: SMC-Scp complex subunit ScpB [Gammaproteobacteria bacterium]|nr:SMC-Scp complex subunit ScpB [Gammaproteobacteria bacterium]
MEVIESEIKKIIEGLLFATDRPLSIADIIKFLGETSGLDKKQIASIIENINHDYDDRGVELKETASGYRFQVRDKLAPWISKLWEERPPRYSKALLETLALIAYRQPITRGEIEEVRGVSVSSNIIRTLEERDWVKVVGHKDVPGRPALYVTTNKFLDYFNLKNLKELPTLSDARDINEVAEQVELELGLCEVDEDGAVD